MGMPEQGFYYCLGCQKKTPSRWCSRTCRELVHLLHRECSSDRFARHDLRLFVLKRDGYKCSICRTPVTNETANVDHIVPWPLGKTNPANLAAICQPCNKAKSNYTGLRAATASNGRRFIRFATKKRPRARFETLPEWNARGDRARADDPAAPATDSLFLPRDCMDCRVKQRLCKVHCVK